jgi:hypothetical protein
LRIIRGSVENPSGVFSAKAFRLRSFVTSVLANEVGGSGFMVRVSGAPKIKGDGFGNKVRVGNLCSKNLQFANLALYRAAVKGSRYLMMDGESYQT